MKTIKLRGCEVTFNHVQGCHIIYIDYTKRKLSEHDINQATNQIKDFMKKERKK